MDYEIPELELPMQHCVELGAPSVVISTTTVHKYFSNVPHHDYPGTPCLDWDKLKRWANSKGWDVKFATEDTDNGKQILPGIRFSPLKEINTLPKSATNPSGQEHPNNGKQHNASNLLNSPIGYVWLTAIGGVLAVIIIFLIRNHFGIPL